MFEIGVCKVQCVCVGVLCNVFLCVVCALWSVCGQRILSVSGVCTVECVW